MNYLQELLESYSRLKQRKLKLLERVSAPPSPEALQLAQQYFQQAGPAQGQKVPVKELPPAYVRINGAGKVVFTGYPGGRYGKEFTLQSKQDIDELARLLDQAQGNKGEQPAPEDDAGQQEVSEKQPGQPTPGEANAPASTYSIIEGDLLDPMTLQGAIEHLPIAEQQLILSQAGRLQNSRWAIDATGKRVITLLGSVMQTRTVINCPDPNVTDCVAKTITDENLLTRAKQVGAVNLQRALQILAQPKVSLEDAQYLRSIIAISEKNQVIIKDPTNKTGIMIHEENPILVPLLKGLSSRHEIDTDEGPTKLDLSDKRKNFLKNDAEIFASKTASTLRGSIFEDLRMGVIELQKCLQTQAMKSNCLSVASEHFTRWSNNPQREDAFRGLIEKCRADGTICIDLDNSDDVFYLDTIINGFGKGSFANAEVAFQKFSRVMMQLAVAGVRDRSPQGVEKVASITGFGQKADTREYYATRELAERALRSVNLNSENVKIIETPRGFAIGDSLKFTTQAKKVDLGQASYSNMIPTIDCALNNEGCDDIIENQIQMLRRSGVTDEDLQYIKKELDAVKKAKEKFMEVAVTTKTILADGGVMVRRSKEKLLKSVLDELDREDTFEGPTSNLRSKIRVMVDNAKTINWKDEGAWESLCGDIAAAIQKNRIAKLFSSDKPKDKRKALGFVVGLGMFGGGSGDHSMLTVADAQNLVTHTTDQNETLRPLAETLSSKEPPKVEIEYNRFIVNGLPIYWDGNRVDTIVPLSYVTDAISRGHGKSTHVRRIKQGEEQPVMQTNSVEYSGQALNEQVITYLMNQQELLTKLLKSITKDA